MPTISRYFLKTGLIWLILSVLILLLRHGAAAEGIGVSDAALRILFYHTLTVGWITQIIMGVSIWMFPRYSPTSRRGPEYYWWAVYVLLNAGLILRSSIEPFGAYHDHTFLSVLLVSAGWIKALACTIYAVLIWRRVANPRKRP